MDPSDQRAALNALIGRDGAALAMLSRVVGRNPAWVQQYLRRGSPKLLPERERGLLAAFFGVAETVLGAPTVEAMVQVPRLAFGASAGPGRQIGDERIVASAGYAPADLAGLGIRPHDAAILDVVGDSMQPALRHGDRILIDRGQRTPAARDAIWVLRIGDELFVKRLIADGADWQVVSDNAAERRVPRDEVAVIGRVAQLIRKL